MLCMRRLAWRMPQGPAQRCGQIVCTLESWYVVSWNRFVLGLDAADVYHGFTLIASMQSVQWDMNLIEMEACVEDVRLFMRTIVLRGEFSL